MEFRHLFVDSTLTLGMKYVGSGLLSVCNQRRHFLVLFHPLLFGSSSWKYGGGNFVSALPFSKKALAARCERIEL